MRHSRILLCLKTPLILRIDAEKIIREIRLFPEQNLWKTVSSVYVYSGLEQKRRECDTTMGIAIDSKCWNMGMV